MYRRFGLSIVCLIAAVVSGQGIVAAQERAKDADTRLFELRTYYPVPGKFEAVQARFRNHTVKLFEKHGMTNIGYWVVADASEDEQKLIYILAHKDRAAADASWKAFRADPNWLKVKAETEKDGPILTKVESLYLRPTDYSAIK